MKTEEQIIDEVYENKVYGICNVLFDALISKENDEQAEEAEARFNRGLKIVQAVRDRAKALLKEELEK